MNLVIMGPPGAGKGTVCSRLLKGYNYKLISAGDLLRAEKASGSELGNEIASIIDKGNLVPDEMITEIILNEFKKPTKAGEFFLVDGYPRTLKQGESLDRMINVTTVIWLTVSEQTTIKRNLERGKTSNRPDDSNVEVIKKRINNYYDSSAPLKEFYKDRIIEVDGEGTPEEVYMGVLRNIKNELTKIVK